MDDPSGKTFVDYLLYGVLLVGSLILLVGVAKLIPEILYSDSLMFLGDAVGALGTVILVAVTFYYVRVTSQLVTVTRNQIDERLQTKEEHLRISLISEIEHPDWDDWANHPEDVPAHIVSWDVYDKQIEHLGLLTNDEREKIYTYYNQLKKVRNLIDRDTEPGTIEAEIRIVKNKQRNAVNELRGELRDHTSDVSEDREHSTQNTDNGSPDTEPEAQS